MRILVLHGDVYGFGGAENHCVRVTEILQSLGHEVTVLHAGGPLDAGRIESWSGIQLNPASVWFKTALPFVKWPRLFAGRTLLRYAVVIRAARQIFHKYDVVVGTYGEVPINSPALIQSTHIPLFFFDEESLRYLGFDARQFKVRHCLRILYVLAARLIAGWRRSTISKADLLVNSDWTGRQFLRHYPRSRPKTIYHGAVTKMGNLFPTTPQFKNRLDNCVIVGRVVALKRVEFAIHVVDSLRSKGKKVGLVIIGRPEGEYGNFIREMVSSRPYVVWHQNLSRADMESLAAKQKWGIHCANHEHYGLAALELLKLGCIVFVPNSGGQIEVVGDERLQYSSLDEAVMKISNVMESTSLQEELRSILGSVARTHTVERFREQFVSHFDTTVSRLIH